MPLKGLSEVCESTGYPETTVLKAAVNYVLAGHFDEFTKLVVNPRGSESSAETQLKEWADTNVDDIIRQFWPVVDNASRVRVIELEMDKVSYTLTILQGKGRLYEP